MLVSQFGITESYIILTNKINCRLYEYDIHGRLIKETDANGNRTSYEYDAINNCIRKINAEETEVCIDYNELNQAVCSYAVTKDGTRYQISYKYDENGNLTAVTDEEGNINYVTVAGDSVKKIR